MRKTIETSKKHNRGFENGKNKMGEETKFPGEDIASLKAKIKKLEFQSERKRKELKSAHAETKRL